MGDLERGEAHLHEGPLGEAGPTGSLRGCALLHAAGQRRRRAEAEIGDRMAGPDPSPRVSRPVRVCRPAAGGRRDVPAGIPQPLAAEAVSAPRAPIPQSAGPGWSPGEEPRPVRVGRTGVEVAAGMNSVRGGATAQPAATAVNGPQFGGHALDGTGGDLRHARTSVVGMHVEGTDCRLRAARALAELVIDLTRGRVAGADGP